MGRRLQTVAAVTCMKTLLMVFNVIFWFTGIGILVAGIWMEVDLYKYLELTTNYNSAVAYVLIGTGVVIILVGTLACCCTAKGIPVLLYLFSSFLMVVFVVQLSAGVSGYAYRSKLGVGFQQGLNRSLNVYLHDINIQHVMDRMQSTLECCGKDEYRDWFSTPWANKTNTVPSSCCKVNKYICKHENLDEGETKDIYTMGCYSTVVDFVDRNIGVIGGTALGFAFFQLIGVLLSCCLAKHINKAKYEQVA